jgi:hypothetical protein
MACVVARSNSSESRDVERVLGLLSSLKASTHTAADDVATFVAPPGTAYLIERALAAMVPSPEGIPPVHKLSA